MINMPIIDIKIQECKKWYIYRKYIKDVAFRILKDYNIYLEILLTEEHIIREFNKNFRNKNKSTNVLSFPAHYHINDNEDNQESLIFIDNVTTNYHNNMDVFSGADISNKEPRIDIGNIILSFQNIKKESIEFKKTFKFRLTHILIHGILHVLGYDHIKKYDRILMEKIETKIMLNFGFGNPYDY